jgi:hypothetical protein
MKALGMTIPQLFIALVVGAVVSIVFVYATAPHPAVVPVQVITPVPTPPPVVITQAPLQLPTQLPLPTQQKAQYLSDPDAAAMMAVFNFIPIVIIAVGILMVLMTTFTMFRLIIPMAAVMTVFLYYFGYMRFA